MKTMTSRRRLVRLYFVQPKSLQECSIIYDDAAIRPVLPPTPAEEAEDGSSVSFSPPVMGDLAPCMESSPRQKSPPVSHSSPRYPSPPTSSLPSHHDQPAHHQCQPARSPCSPLTSSSFLSLPVMTILKTDLTTSSPNMNTSTKVW